LESWHNKAVSEEVEHILEGPERSIDKNSAIFLFQLLLNELGVHFRFWNLQQQPISYLGLTCGTTDVEGDDIVVVELCQLRPDWSCRWY